MHCFRWQEAARLRHRVRERGLGHRGTVEADRQRARAGRPHLDLRGARIGQGEEDAHRLAPLAQPVGLRAGAVQVGESDGVQLLRGSAEALGAGTS